MAVPSARTVLTAEDFHAVNKLCNCYWETFENLGTYFISTFSARRSPIAIGTALMHIFKEYDGKTKIPQRLILIYYLYRVGDLDVLVDRRKQSTEEQINDLLWHPFLAFFISLMEEDGENVSESISEDSFGPLPKANMYERFLLGHLLKGKHNDIATRTVNDLMQSVYRNSEMSEEFAAKCFTLERYKEALKQREATYSSLVSASVPALIKLPDQSRECCEETFMRSLLHITCNPFMADVLPPSFHRVTPTLMPPSDDEFQFLYPFLLEPIWMDAETLKPDMNVPMSYCRDDADRSTQNNSNKISSESSAPTSLPENTDTDRTVNSLPHTPPSGIKAVDDSAEPKRKWGTSLPSSPKTPTSVSNKESSSVSRSSRAVSLGSLPYVRSNSAETDKTALEDTSFPAETTSITSSLSEKEKEKDKKPPLTHAEAVELMKKSLVSVIARTEAQRLSEAIAADGSIADVVDMPISQYPKFIDDNPIVAAAVIVRRVNKNAEELDAFFDLLLNMNLSVQGMEVVNKLYTIEFPQDYLNSYISMCVQRCEDPTQSSFAQSRQVRMVCVFLSSLIRNGTWDVHPLSVELQSFVLKFNRVREAVSLYQAILVALQPPENAVSTNSSTSITQESTTVSSCESTTPS